MAILQRLGRTADFVTPASKSYDATTGVTTFMSPAINTATVSPPLMYERKYIDDTTIQDGDAQLILAAQGLTFTPTLKHEVHFDSTEWQIVSLRPVYSGEQIAVYMLQVRGGSIASIAGTTVQSTLDSRLPARVETIIDRFGKQAKFLPLAVRALDPATGATDERGVCEFCEKVVLDENEEMMTNTRTDERRKVRAYMKAHNLGFTPYVSLEAQYDGLEWDITNVELVYTGGKVGLWILDMER